MTGRRRPRRTAPALALGLIPLACGEFLAAQTPPGASSGPVEDVRLSGEVGEFVESLAASGQLWGTVLVARQGRPIYEEAFGLASVELGVRNTPATRHGVGSLTKLLTAVLAFSLADKGVIDLTDPLSTYLPSFPHGDVISLNQLLRHRSGIPHRVTADTDVSAPRTAEDMARLAAAAPLLFPPDSLRRYSSAGYSVMARALEVATGLAYGELLRREVLRPVGALHSLSDDGWSPVPGRSEDHVLGAEGPVPAQPANLSFLVGAGSVFGTPRDLLAVVEGIAGGTYGRSARDEILGADGTLAWNGQTFGYRAFLDRYDDGSTVVFAGNLHTGAADVLRRGLSRILTGSGPPNPEVPAWEAVELSTGLLAEIEGVYQFRAGEPDSEEALRFTPGGRSAVLGSWVLVPVSEERLVSTVDYGMLSIVRGPEGDVEGLRWGDEGEGFFLPKVRPVR